MYHTDGITEQALKEAKRTARKIAGLRPDETKHPLPTQDPFLKGQNRVEKLLELILMELQGARLDHELWTSQEVCKYLRISSKTLLKHMRQTKGFPKPLKMPDGFSQGSYKFSAGEIRNYIFDVNQDR